MSIENKFNKLIIISSPSGAGKTTICKFLLKKMKQIELSISYTTRQMRINEKNAKDYFFVETNDFLKLKKENFFIETAKNFNNYYGSPFINIKNAFKKNNHILFDIDWKGAKKIRKKFNSDQIIDFFILPPSKKELKRRLQKRGCDNFSEIQVRLSYALTEISHHIDYKYVLINDNIYETINNLLKIIKYNIFISEIKQKVNKELKFIK